MAIIKNRKDLINRFLILVITLAFASLLTVGFQLDITAGIIISMIFMVMTIEDYIYMEVDLRLIGFLAFVGLFTTHAPPLEYFFFMFLGLLYYRIVYLLLLRIRPDEDGNDAQSFLDESKAFGFLPAIACGLAIYSFYLTENIWQRPAFLKIFFDSTQELYLFVLEEPLMAFLMFLPLIVLWVALEFRRHRAETGNKLVIPMVGDGDVYVLAVWIGILGFVDMTMVFLISIMVQTLVFLYRDAIEENKRRKGELK